MIFFSAAGCSSKMRSVEAKAAAGPIKGILPLVLIGCGRTLQLDDGLAAQCHTAWEPRLHATVCSYLAQYFFKYRANSEFSCKDVSIINSKKCEKLRLVGPNAEEYDGIDLESMLMDFKITLPIHYEDFVFLAACMRKCRLRPVSRDSFIEVMHEFYEFLSGLDFEAVSSDREYLTEAALHFLSIQSLLLRRSEQQTVPVTLIKRVLGEIAGKGKVFAEMVKRKIENPRI
eukprot:Gregarina_sp_Poly_1__5440@NODE_2877_length_1604_cov_10_388419_g1818_i0_p1_GENE_NODE_2877_length_1604_cov_10_388419_g1818_i0NODE_2877_length_1604_cov_10_388419_g1818_i0_p1_ORF_typecomplete_len230_score20_86_NODE_2877_length_1604_cov_10_388419_g1818_i07311420